MDFNRSGIAKGDLRTRRIGGMTFNLSVVAKTKKIANTQADYWRGKGALVRVVKLPRYYGLFTR